MPAPIVPAPTTPMSTILPSSAASTMRGPLRTALGDRLPVGLYIPFLVEGDLQRIAAPVRVRDENFLVARGVVDPRTRFSGAREGDLAPAWREDGVAVVEAAVDEWNVVGA